MKLLYCVQCQDVIRLVSAEQHCKCGACGGHYINALDAVFWGTAMPLGFDNHSFGDALEAQLKGPGPGTVFEAFVLPEDCDTMKKIMHPSKKLSDDTQATGKAR